MPRPRPSTAALALAYSLALAIVSACASTPRGEPGAVRVPRYDHTALDWFFTPYRAAFSEVAGPALPDRQLVQLGLPDTDKVVVWYALDGRATAGGPIAVTVDGAPVTASHLSVNGNSIHHTGRIEVSGLRSGTSYQLRISGGGLTPRALVAKTAPAGAESFSFLFGSCFAPYNTDSIGHIGAGERASMLNFRDRAAAPNGPSFFIGLGDQMYTDPGAYEKNRDLAYLHGRHSEWIRGTPDLVPAYLNLLNRFSFGLPGMDSGFAAMPSVMMWDDHDIRDGWGSQNDENDPAWRAFYYQARDAFAAFQGARNPNFASIVNARGWDHPLPAGSIRNDARFDERQVEEMDFTFDRGLATFFVVDARSAKWRGPELNGRQFERIKAWLSNPARRDKPTVFVFGFPVPVAANVSKIVHDGQIVPFKDNQDDAWDRIYRSDRQKLLELFARHFAAQPRHTLVIISGDVHYSGLQSIRQGGSEGRTYGYEVISSGIAQTKYNDWGIYNGTVSGYPRLNLDLNPNLVPWVQDHGAYAGPSFAELFVDAPKDSISGPQLALEFYPATFGSAAFRLHGDGSTGDWPHPIKSYPENQLGRRAFWLFGNQRTINELPELLEEWWVKGGRADALRH